ncbi:hypothetical protein [Leifsonia sp. Root112D2]|uniref:hypothetical protein n=1 Tax=Leifsonia sp. Root112D2 TaxID=1736426 RepID=UPI0006FC3C7C|nr:hypothetical protein [Leifsonia sp. Root112D2]KQV07629.1 hypothetical protein ASC63_10385 [Leifsonia sp. Root112D2]
MFGRRRHVAAAPAAPAPQLTEDQIFELVQYQLAASFGAEGEWTVSRRTEAHTDAIFHGVLVKSVTADIITALRDARQQLEAGAAATPVAVIVAEHDEPGAHVAPLETPDAAAKQLEPAAFGWEPAPITVWADLRKPVTGEIPQLRAPALVA